VEERRSRVLGVGADEVVGEKGSRSRSFELRSIPRVGSVVVFGGVVRRDEELDWEGLSLVLGEFSLSLLMRSFSFFSASKRSFNSSLALNRSFHSRFKSLFSSLLCFNAVSNSCTFRSRDRIFSLAAASAS